MFDGKAIGEQFTLIVRDYVSRALAQVTERFERLEAAVAKVPERGEKGEAGEKGIDGKDGRAGKDGADGLHGKDGANGRDGVNGEKGDPGNDGRDGKDGQSVDPALVEATIKAAIALIPAPKDGRDGKDGANGINGKDGAPGATGKDGANGINGKDGTDGLHGKDADPQEIAAEVLATVTKAFDAIPIPKDGKDGINGKDGQAGKDGASITVDDVRPMLEAAHAKWALEFERRASDLLQRAIDNMPRPKDGKDGQDGVSFDSFEWVSLDEGRTYRMSFKAGDRVVSSDCKAPTVIYRGVWHAGSYDQGDSVTYGGSQWIARKDTDAVPGSGSPDWTLAVKSGRPGRDAPGAA